MEDDGNNEKDVHLTVRISNRLDREIEEWSDRRGYSRSEAVRTLLKNGLDYDDKIGEIEDQIYELEVKVQDIDKRTSELASEGDELGMYHYSQGATEESDLDQDDP